MRTRTIIAATLVGIFSTFSMTSAEPPPIASSVEANLPEWVFQDSDDYPCDFAWAFGDWKLKTNIPLSGNIPDITVPDIKWNFLGVVIQQVLRLPRKYECGATVYGNTPVMYYEWMPIAEYAEFEDSLGSGDITHDVYGTEFIRGTSVWIPFNPQTEQLLRELMADVIDSFNKDVDPHTQEIYIKDSQLNILCSGTTCLQSGRYENSPNPPQANDPSKNFGNLYGGLGELMVPHYLSFMASCCDYPGYSTHRAE